MSTHALTDEQWNAVSQRDPSLADAFLLGVTTTLVFCRVGCPARTPNRDNVMVFAAPEAALRAGYRPCKRCKPLDLQGLPPSIRLVADVVKLIEHADESLTLSELATACGRSPEHVQRVFLSVTGVSPSDWMRAKQQAVLRTSLQTDESITGAMINAGYNLSSAGYARARKELGMSPRQYASKGQGSSVRYAVVDTWLGSTLIAFSEAGVCRVAFGDSTDDLVAMIHAEYAHADLTPQSDEDAALLAAAVSAIDHPERSHDLPIDLRGTAFQLRVWSALRNIPAGQPWSYSDLAAAIDAPTSVRAVASTCASNDVAVLIPCHRVVGKSGSLTGYRWGIERKRQLLERESSAD